MGACSRQTFNNVSETSWDKIKNAVKSELGIVIASNKGQESKDGFTISWNYIPSNQELDIQAVNSPWYVPCSLINNKIHELIEGVLHSEAAKITQMV
ncbi:hypothetical protein SAMN04489761_0924 [Tenacibaculum sp. MAR_2009_124]|uniref:hypothetical protein n=1 Tax=Tenacibaculum sp. MAR_2009_124 TaxID=1250059 RepID=UPI0008971FAB|nr:hypothetical protein [Tenacibaculum sp. MAR_2009_124]SEB47372.1 hypothetical protein SAMN04489761_0924 [Tenacibaculum sp. MAR_2009_124]